MSAVELEFPCEHVFKVFFSAEAAPTCRVQALQAINRVLPCAEDALRERQSAKGNYVCVSIAVYLHNRDQLEAIYASLRTLEGVVYLL